jgi:alpha-L-arabinofuranosidase
VNISLVNVDPSAESEVLIDLRGGEYSGVTGRILSGAELNAHNTFDKSETVRPVTFTGARLKKNILSLKVPPASVVVLTVN